jgi:hypothetical protein
MLAHTKCNDSFVGDVTSISIMTALLEWCDYVAKWWQNGEEVKPRVSDKGEATIVTSLPFREKRFGVVERLRAARGKWEGCKKKNND